MGTEHLPAHLPAFYPRFIEEQSSALRTRSSYRHGSFENSCIYTAFIWGNGQKVLISWFASKCERLKDINFMFWRVMCVNGMTYTYIWIIICVAQNINIQKYTCVYISVNMWLRVCSQICHNWSPLSSSGLDSDESCEGGSESSFKDALVDGGSQKNNGSVPQKNGIKKHR